MTARDPAEIERFKHENAVMIDGNDIPRPIMSFEEASLPGDFNFFHRLKMFYLILY